MKDFQQIRMTFWNNSNPSALYQTMKYGVTKLKAFADDQINVIENLKFVMG